MEDEYKHGTIGCYSYLWIGLVTLVVLNTTDIISTLHTDLDNAMFMFQKTYSNIYIKTQLYFYGMLY